MAKRSTIGVSRLREIKAPKKSSSSGNPHMVKTSSMNKNKRRYFKKYRGQGR